MSAAAVLSDCFGADSLSLMGRSRPDEPLLGGTDNIRSHALLSRLHRPSNLRSEVVYWTGDVDNSTERTSRLVS
jgi:hypothetical protein